MLFAHQEKYRNTLLGVVDTLQVREVNPEDLGQNTRSFGQDSKWFLPDTKQQCFAHNTDTLGVSFNEYAILS
jgi:hypothetical protein